METIKKFVKVGQAVRNGMDSCHYCAWILQEIDAVNEETTDEYEFLALQCIRPVAVYWDKYGLCEDQLSGAIAILSIISAFDYDTDLAAELRPINTERLETGAWSDSDDIEFGEYLQKVAEILK